MKTTVMNSQTVEITSGGIRKILNRYTPERAISEYIWNGFDAKASIIHINYEYENEELGTIKRIKISDNGTGICYEDLSAKFKKFYESQKRINNENNTDLTRGKNGYGRFTFYKFARFGQWNTSYLRGDQIMSYNIKINSDNLIDYSPTEPVITQDVDTGTCVIFDDIKSELSCEYIKNKLIPYLKAEFAWFLELKEEYKIYVNNEELIYSSIIAEQESVDITLSTSEHHKGTFNCKFIRWNTKMNDEYSRFYFLNKELELKFTKTTLLNKKGDDFWHSIIVVDDFFNGIDCDIDKDEDSSIVKLFQDSKDIKLFKDLIAKLNDFLKKKRRPFLKEKAQQIVAKFKQEKVFPDFGSNDWDKVRKDGLEDLVKNMYEVEPAIFMKLNKEQKKIFLELLNLVMDSSERNNLFKIIEAVVELDSNDRKEFAKILEVTKLKQVISTIELIRDRLLTLQNLKQLVFQHSLEAGEIKNLQVFIEKHYWIFGEEYRMVCSEEVKFEEALKKYLYILRGVTKKVYIDHPDKYKEMDLFLTGADFRGGSPHNIVVEIKNPTTIKRLKSEQLNQLEEYMDVILKQDCFNDANEHWTFILIGQDYDDIVGRRITNKLTGLTQSGDNYSLYVKKWSEIINEVERRHKYLLDKLKIERASLSKSNSLNDTMEEFSNNTAVMNI